MVKHNTRNASTLWLYDKSLKVWSTYTTQINYWWNQSLVLALQLKRPPWRWAGQRGWVWGEREYWPLLHTGHSGQQHGVHGVDSTLLRRNPDSVTNHRLGYNHLPLQPSTSHRCWDVYQDCHMLWARLVQQQLLWLPVIQCVYISVWIRESN